jgi:hypothetical protein
MQNIVLLRQKYITQVEPENLLLLLCPVVDYKIVLLQDRKNITHSLVVKLSVLERMHALS